MTDEEHECPYCPRTFEARCGLGNHLSAKHGENLKITLECEHCGGDYEVIPARKDISRFCSRECKAEWQEDGLTGDNSPRWQGGEVKTECEYCGDEYKVKPAEENLSRFCGAECMSAWQAENWEGDKNPAWKGGRIQDYGPKWKQTREEIRERDGYCCQSCGTPQEDLNRKLHIHHIKPRRDFKNESGEIDFERANDSSNLISLCGSCHKKYEGLPVVPRAAD
jgi:hypothetical protein